MSSNVPSVLLLPELLSEIFLHVHAQATRESRFIATNATPLALSKVCSSWYATARSTPELWSTVALTSRHWSDQENNLALLNYYLRFSGALPLDIYIEFDASDPYYPSHLNDPTPFVAAISRHAARWRHVTLKLPVEAMARFTAQLPTLPAPSLLTLQLHETQCLIGPSSPVDLPPQPTFRLPWEIPSKEERTITLFPSLRSLGFSWVPSSETISLFPIEQIRELSLIPHYNHTNQLTPPDAASLLASFSSLSKLKLSISKLQDTPTNLAQITQLQQSVTLKNLESVAFSGHPEVVSEMWSMFHKLPKLSWVQVRYPANDPDEEAFATLLDRSDRTLKPDDEDDFGSWEDGAWELVDKY
ncbi:hypothetical protein BDV98DRAFT_590687 [Pterulicium gracile]|uniref:Uncharacterized protein n=1 Tax=Pterulicium gracile TaxID=1884261 RepID=A0A5C3QQZ8_9AGAR|nr:hypothetical protein BDV98DRAFT_590687 [Pterula gracilis]